MKQRGVFDLSPTWDDSPLQAKYCSKVILTRLFQIDATVIVENEYIFLPLSKFDPSELRYDLLIILQWLYCKLLKAHLAQLP